MEYISLGGTGLLASSVAFGAVSKSNIKDTSFAVDILQSAYRCGVNFFDTKYSLTFSQEIVGQALCDVRADILLGATTTASCVSDLLLQIEETLTALKTNYIDLYKIENPKGIIQGECPFYEQLLLLKDSCKIKHIGLVTDDLDIALEATKNPIFEVIQFPFSVLSSTKVQDLLDICKKKSLGFIATQPLCGGVVSSIPLAFGFLAQNENIISLWSPQTKQELEQILYFQANPPVIDERFKADAQNTRAFFN